MFYWEFDLFDLAATLFHEINEAFSQGKLVWFNQISQLANQISGPEKGPEKEPG